MNFAPFTGHIPTAAAMPTIHQFAAKFGYEGGSQETRYQSGGVQFAVAPAAGTVAVDGVKFRQAESLVVVSSAPAGSVTLAGIAPIHTVNTGVKYQTISSSVNLGSVAYAPGYAAELKDGKRDFRDDITHDIMATMMQQQVSPSPLQQGAGQLVVVLHEPKEAAALARAIKQEGRAERAQPMPAEFISIGDVSDATWQSLGGGVADYLSALPLPLHHLLKYSDKREEPAPATPVVNGQHAGEHGCGAGGGGDAAAARAAEEEEEEEGGQREETPPQTWGDTAHYRARRQHPVLLPGVPHGVPGARPAGPASGRPHHGEEVHLRHLQRGVEAQGPPDAAQAVAQPRAAARLLRVPQGVQAQGTTHVALRHTLGREATCLQRVRQGLLPQGPPAQAHALAHRAAREGRAVAAGGVAGARGALLTRRQARPAHAHRRRQGRLLTGRGPLVLLYYHTEDCTPFRI